MKRVLFVGFDPTTVDFSDPALPPGMTAEKIHTGVKLALADFAGRGWHAQNCFIRPDETAIPTIDLGRLGPPAMKSFLGASGRVGSTVDRLIATIDSESSDTEAHDASSSLPFVNELSASTENRAGLIATDSARQDHAAQHTRRRANHFLVGRCARPSLRYQLAHPS